MRVDPVSGAVSEIATDLNLTGEAWAGVDISPDGTLLILTDDATGRAVTLTR